jgi:hypothetical protein
LFGREFFKQTEISPIKASRRASVISLSIARNEADKQFDAGVFLRSKAFSQI